VVTALSSLGRYVELDWIASAMGRGDREIAQKAQGKIAVHDAWERGYVEVNQAFARAIIDEAMRSTSPPIVILNDYHLYLVGAYLRRQMPDLVIQHFTHIPWPSD
jgi:trehalose-6-phosphate synthase